MDFEQIAGWYSSTSAAERLSANCGRPVDKNYVRTLARYGLIRSVKVSDKLRLYKQEDVDCYIVERRGVKAKRRKRQSALANKAAP